MKITYLELESAFPSGAQDGVHPIPSYPFSRQPSPSKVGWDER